MDKIVFATHNEHKLQEVKMILKDIVEVVGLTEIGCMEEIPEDGNTLEENAQAKAMYVYEKYGLNCFADDTGFEISALDNKPGVYSARYAGEPANSQNNIHKVLKEMDGVSDRNARFRTAIAYVENGNVHYFEGIVNGVVQTSIIGHGGFGYDPIFTPDGYNENFAQMSAETKNEISHRGKAIRNFIAYFQAKKVNNNNK